MRWVLRGGDWTVRKPVKRIMKLGEVEGEGGSVPVPFSKWGNEDVFGGGDEDLGGVLKM